MKFKLTVRSYVYLFFSIFVLILGLVRGEIFSSIAGIMLCLYFLYSLLATVITLQFWKNQKPIVTVRKNEFIILPKNIKSKTEKKIKTFPLIFPGCYVDYVFNFSVGKNKNLISTNCIVNLRQNSKSEVFAPKKRGKYFCENKFLRITDITHCYEFILMQDGNEHIPAYFVFPTPDKRNFPMNVPLLFAEDSNEKKNMQRNDELYDVRQYFPGDDTRKINWKVYAHLNDLTIRQGEFLPPPQKRFSVFVEAPIITKTELAQDEITQYDIFINKVTAFLLWMIQQGYSFKLAVLENDKLVFDEILADSDEAKNQVLKLLSIPQITFTSNLKPIENITVAELTTAIVKDEGLMYFMYANSSNFDFFVKTFSKLRERTFVYTGPNLSMPEPKSLMQKFLFENKTSKLEIKCLEKLYANLNSKINEFRQERYYADKI